MFMNKTLWVLLLGVAAVLAAAASWLLPVSPNDQTLRTDPPLAGEQVPIPPREVTLLDGAADRAQLVDVDGRQVPLSREQYRGDTVLLANLLAGEYTLQSPHGQATFQVTSGGAEDAVVSQPIEQDMNASWLLLLLPASGLLLAGVLLARRRTMAGVSLAVGMAGLSGVIFAVQEPDELPSIEACTAAYPLGSAEQERCLIDRLTQTLEREGVHAAVGELRDTQIAACHDVGHELGRRAWLIAGPEEALQRGLELCANAYYHGAVYGAATYMDDEQFLPLAARHCLMIYDTDSPHMSSCAHGVGHAAALRLGGDLYESMAVCDDMLPDREDFVLECRGAALSEYSLHYFQSQAMGADPAPPGVAPEQLCGEVEDELVSYCYGGVAMAHAADASGRRDGGRYQGADALLQLCVDEFEPGDELRLACIAGLAGELRNFLGMDTSKFDVCTMFDRDDERRQCVMSGAYHVHRGTGDRDDTRIACEAGQVDQQVCDEAITDAERIMD